MHCGDDNPDWLPNRPDGHRPEQAAVGIAASAPNRPAEHVKHTDMPVVLYVPAGQGLAA